MIEVIYKAERRGEVILGRFFVYDYRFSSFE